MTPTPAFPRPARLAFWRRRDTLPRWQWLLAAAWLSTWTAWAAHTDGQRHGAQLAETCALRDLHAAQDVEQRVAAVEGRLRDVLLACEWAAAAVRVEMDAQVVEVRR